MTRRSAAYVLLVVLAAGATIASATAWSLLREALSNARNESLAGSLRDLLPPAMGSNAQIRPLVLEDAPFAANAQAYIASINGRSEVLLLPLRAEGYAGAIDLLLGIDRGGRICGVRLVAQQETPGLGDAIEPRNSDWLQQFIGRSLPDAPDGQWSVRADGGTIDQISGATITSAALVRTLRHALEYAARNPQLFAPQPEGLADD